MGVTEILRYALDDKMAIFYYFLYVSSISLLRCSKRLSFKRSTYHSKTIIPYEAPKVIHFSVSLISVFRGRK